MPQQAVDSTAHDRNTTHPRGGTGEFTDKVNQLLSELRVESDALQRESSEIEMLLRQTNGEVEKLANRELAATRRYVRGDRRVESVARALSRAA